MNASAFDIRGVPESHRFSHWQDAICQTYLTVDCQRLNDSPLEGFITARTLGELALSEVASPAMTYERGVNELKKCHEEYFQLVLVLAGQGSVEQGDKQALIKPGDMVIYSSTEHSKVSYPAGSITQVVKIPRPLLADRIGHIDMISATLLNTTTPIGAMTRHLVQECMGIPIEEHCSSSRFSNGILDILATAIESNLPLPVNANPRASQALLRVKQNTEKRLADPDLDVQKIADENSVSIRTLNRLFAAEGTTTMRWVWSRRLAHSHKALSEGAVRQVSQVAFDWGFNDLSHFSKAFKKKYGIPPHELLRNRH